MRDGAVWLLVCRIAWGRRTHTHAHTHIHNIVVNINCMAGDFDIPSHGLLDLPVHRYETIFRGVEGCLAA